MMEKEEGKIPFSKAVNVGNFKVWRSRVSYELTADDVKDEEKRELVKAGKLKFKRKRMEVEAINISDLEGQWMVRIPQTLAMYATLTELYATSQTSEDKDQKAIATGALRTMIANMYYVSCVNNGYYHQGVDLVTAAYANPDVLKGGKDGKEFRKDVDALIKAFLDWRVMYDKAMKAKEPDEEEMRQEEKAEDMVKALAEQAAKEQ